MRALAHVGAVVFSLVTVAAWGATPPGWPSLEEAVALAQERAPQVAAARGQVEVAQSAGVRAAMLPIGNPYVQVFVDRTQLGPGGFQQPTPWTYVQPELYVPINVPGQRGARMAEADRLLDWRRGERADVQSRVLGEVVVAYGQAVLARQQVQTAQAALELAQEEESIMKQRLALQDATALDVQLAAAETARYAQQRTEAEFQFVEARARLAALTGLHGLALPDGVALGLPALRRNWDQAALANAVEDAPLLGALRAEENYWAAARTRAEADKIPPITLIAWGSRGDQGEVRLGGGVGWTIPMFDVNQGEVARTLAERSRATATREALRPALHARLLAGLQAHRAVEQALTVLDTQGLPAQQALVASTQAAFVAGKVDRLRVVLARRDLAAARERRLQLLHNAWRAYGEMAAILGVLP